MTAVPNPQPNTAQAPLQNIAPFIWDMHSCPSLRPDGDLTVALESHRAAGFDAVTVNVGFSLTSLMAMTRTIASFRHQLREHADRYLLVQTAHDLANARAARRLAVSFDVEGLEPIGDQLDMVNLLYDLRVRWMAFVYNRSNLIGYGCHDEADLGLTQFGRKVVERMDSVGMIKCCSHAGYRTALEIFTSSAKPTILSHSNPRKLVDHERNVPDYVLRACEQAGGVVGINGVGLFLGAQEPRAADLFRHVDYVVQMIGPKHVGIALDSEFPSSVDGDDEFSHRNAEVWPSSKGYQEHMNILGPEVTAEFVTMMQEAGYPSSSIAGILGGNFARVASECWK